MKRLRQGRLEEAEELADRAIKEFRACKPDPWSRCDLGKALRVAADVQLAIGRLDRAFELIGDAKDIFSSPEMVKHQSCKWDAVAFFHDTSVVLRDHGMAELAAEFLDKAEHLAVGYAKAEALVAETRSQLKYEAPAQGFVTAGPAAGELRAAIQQAKGADWVAKAANLVSVLWSSSEPADVIEGAEWLTKWWPEARSSFTIDQLSSPLVAFGNHPEVSVVSVPGVEQVMQEMLATARAARSPAAIDRSLVALATFHVGNEDWGTGFWFAAEAVVSVGATADSQTTTTLRSMASQYLSQARRLALYAAVRSGWHQTVAEIIEHSRLQAIITPVAASGSADEDDLRFTLDLGRRHLGAPSYVAVDGRSVLAEIAAQTGQSAPTIDLDPAFISVDGEARAWYGSWVGLGSAFGVYRSAAGNWGSCGELKSAFDSVDWVGSLSSDSDQPGVRSAAMYSSPQRESAAMLDVGDAVLPSLMRADLNSNRMNSVAPVLAVSADRLMTTVPLCGVAAVSPEGDVLRLVEGFHLVVLPPEFLRRQLVASASPAASDQRRLFAVLDPKGNLNSKSYVVPADLAAEMTLVGSRHIETGDSPENAKLATRSNTKELLNRAAEVGGLFYYVGHSSQHELDPLASSLELHDGDLSALDLLSTGVRAAPEAMLSSCSSSGGQALMSGEWSGLPAALLAAGCSELVVTGWDVPDTAFTSRFDEMVIARWMAGQSLDAALRSTQCDAHTTWMAENYGSETEALLELNSRALPMIWGSYCFVGL